jgi:regulation of enolase protein 1 (concanavalin A-like superfamily)
MMARITGLVCVGLILALGVPAPAQQPNVAETLLVDLRAADLPYGSVTGTWKNNGTLSDFTARGTPVVEDVAGLKAVTFDGSCWFDGPSSVPGIEGKGTRSIEVWAYNPSIPAEETLVHWSHRGGPDGTNMAFNYGNNGSYGAVGHWGAPDMGWGGSVSPAPAAGKWWYLVYTYDGSTARLYANGAAAGSKGVVLDTFGGNIIRVAAQGNTTGSAPDQAFNFTGSIAEVRIHDGVLTAQQIAANYKLGGPRVATGPDPADGALGVLAPLLRWTAGTTAKTHNVYLGTSPDLGAADLIAKNIGMAMYYYTGVLLPGTSYYWRVDEIEADGKTVYTGDVWHFMTIAMTAYAPTPPDGARLQNPDVDLSWMIGKNASRHALYFGTSRDDVAAGTGNTAQGELLEATFDPGTLAGGTTYYWRVDEIEGGGTIQVGPVWSFTTVPDIAITDPNLAGWWKFDEGEGKLAVDSSGHGRHGTILGGTQWIEGYDGGALRLNGSDGYVALPIDDVVGSCSSMTVTTWTNWRGTGGAWQRVFDFGTGTTFNMMVTPANGANGNLRFVITVESYNNEQQLNAVNPQPTGWHHVAVSINGRTRGMEMFVDGQSVATGMTNVLPKDLGQTTQNWIGRSQYPADAFYSGSVDDFRVYDFAMNAEQIRQTMRGDPLLAWSPHPANGAIVDVLSAAPLTWSAGQQAVQHDVYLGSDAAAVAAADTSDASGIYRGRQSATSFTPTPGVAGGAAYAWRVDEVQADGTINRGRVWSFTVADYLIIDDFESYNDAENQGTRIYETWIDGYADGSSGSTVGNLNPPFAEQRIVHGGKQAMPLDYNNVVSPYYSEAVRTWDKPQDWTFGGVTTLVLYFRGQPVSFVENAAGLTMSAAGTDIWNFTDECRFAYKRLSGNGAIVVKVDSLVNTDGWAKAGVMIRESLAADAAHAGVVITPSNGVSFVRRPFAANESVQINQTGVAAPYWVKLTRTDNVFKAEHSADGKTWTSVGTDPAASQATITMAATVYIGVCLTSHNANATTTAQFSNITTSGTGAWQVAEIGVDHPGNTQQSLYVAVEDSTGKAATIAHPDPAATLTTEWTEWQIPLGDLTGVSVSKVKKMYIGVGSKKNPQPDGAGRIYIDDIRLTNP